MSGFDDADLGAARNLYALASRLFAAEIDQPLYRGLLAAGEDPRLRPMGFVLIEPSLRAMGEERAMLELSVEYCRLFIGPRPACPPYGSLRRNEAMVGGRAERGINQFMLRHGLSVRVPAATPMIANDHLAVGLALLSYLHHIQSAEATDPDGAARARDAAEELLTRHLLPWVPDYLAELQAKALLAPYSSVAQVTEFCLRTEESALRPSG
ncbi:hypothetical protein E1264_09525 [Actinomadura sp. KC216]|uniref:TorD/DmsD family molecular chaperone n=1 Tax=Actinomadura sp. KC216 TaxID=2530370 RepID=UPI0010474DD5|nr:molecular chaperone TorD family protein [Actinomadura sp. KC216]TDB89015.1 hypothetical protein E1264_09525 [Actinomadura sp. KC216]